MSAMEDGDSIGQEFDFRQRVRSEEKRCCAALQHLAFQKLTKRGGGDGVEAARRLIEQEDVWRMKEGAREAKPLQGTGGKSADLSVERLAQLKLISELSNAGASGGG